MADTKNKHGYCTRCGERLDYIQRFYTTRRYETDDVAQGALDSEEDYVTSEWHCNECSWMNDYDEYEREECPEHAVGVLPREA